MGADYEVNPRKTIELGTDQNQVAGATQYWNWGASSNAINSKRVVITRAMVIEELHAMLHVAPGGVDTVTFTLVVNGVATAMVVVITGAAVYNVTLANPQTLAAGDYISIRSVYSATAAGSIPSATVRGPEI